MLVEGANKGILPPLAISSAEAGQNPPAGSGKDDSAAAVEAEQSQQQAHQQQSTLIGVAKHVLSEELLLYLDRARALVTGGVPDFCWTGCLGPRIELCAHHTLHSVSLPA